MLKGVETVTDLEIHGCAVSVMAYIIHNAGDSLPLTPFFTRLGAFRYSKGWINIILSQEVISLYWKTDVPS
jgi:hypothetical protein